MDHARNLDTEGTGEQVVLVDADDRETGVASKLAAHVEGLRHRAISVILVNGRGEMLLHRRAPGKYHSGGLWTNACCSHPRPGESPAAAAERRLREEMGILTPLEPLFVTAYRARVGDLVEDELVHVFGGFHEGGCAPDPEEIDAVEWRGIDQLVADMAANPGRYTVWFVKYMAEFKASVTALAARHRAS